MMSRTANALTNNAIGYLRVSTTEQAHSGLGLEAQRHAIETYCQRQSLTLAALHADEGVSGAAPLTERSALLAALESLTPGSVLVVARLDRLSRGDAIEAAIIESLAARKRARIVSTNGEGTDGDGPAATLTRQLLQAIAGYERALIAARTKAALRAKIARGEQAGTARFGATEQERAALDIIEDGRAAGYSFTAIADELNAKGFTTRSGQPWRFEYVRGIIRTREGTRTVPTNRHRATRAAMALIAG